MLIEFRVENHRSLRDEQALTMEAGRGGPADDKRPRNVSGYADHILPVAAIYGANASGKSNILSALAFMRNAVVHSHRSWEPDEGVPREAFAWGRKDDPSLFEATVLFDSVRYQYGFLANSQSFVEEWLYAWPHGKKQVWYERDNSDFNFGVNLKGENKLIEEVTRSNALFLSAAVQHKHPQLSQVFNWFRNLYLINMPIPRNAFGPVFGSRTLPVANSRSYRRYAAANALSRGWIFLTGFGPCCATRTLASWICGLSELSHRMNRLGILVCAYVFS